MKVLKLSTKLVLAFLCVGILPVCVIGIVCLNQASQSLQTESTNKLIAARDIKKAQIEDFFEERQNNMNALVDTVSTLRHEAFEKLTAVREIKRAAVERYFQSIHDQILTFSEDTMIIDAMKTFQAQFKNVQRETLVTPYDLAMMKQELLTYYTQDFMQAYQNQNNDQTIDAEQFFRQLDIDSVVLQYHYIKNNPQPLGSKHLLDKSDDASAYSAFHAQVHPVIRNYLDKFGYYDIFLADPDTGDIVYSVFKELDYSTSLIDGPYSQTNFGEAFRKANEAGNKDAVILVDYAQYTPSYEAPASFVASPIFNGDQKIGIALFQMPIDRLNTIMSERAGLGETGETYLVGRDMRMRSDSFLNPNGHSVTASFAGTVSENGCDTEAAQKALTGQTDAGSIIDYKHFNA